MFLTSKRNSVTPVTINIEELLTPIRELAKVLRKENNYSKDEIAKLDDEDFRSYEKMEMKEDSEFSVACDKYISDTLSFSNNFSISKKTTIIAIVKDDNRLILIQEAKKVGQESGVSDLKYIFCKKQILKEYAKNQFGQELGFICDMEKPYTYDSAVSYNKDQKIDIKASLIPKDYFNLQDLKKAYIDYENIWINKNLVNTNYSVDIDLNYETDVPIMMYYSNDKPIGIVIGDHILVMDPIIYDHIIPSKQALFIWWNMQHNIFNHVIKDDPVKSELINKFLSSTKNDEFCKDLTFLENNFYRTDKPIDGTERFYQKILRFDKLEGEQSGLELFVKGLEYKEQNLKTFSEIAEENPSEALLGVFRKEKIDENYQLQSIYEEKDHKVFLRKNYGEPKSVDPKSVYILRPEIAYYYIKDFFENLLCEILKEVLNDQKIDGFVRNYTLSYAPGKENEYDFIVKKGDKLFVIEAKTTLSTRNMNEFLKTAEEYLKHTGLHPTQVEFILVGLHSKPELFALNRIYREVEPGFNTYPDGCKSPIFYFKPQIDKTKKTIHCFNHPIYSVLKATLIKIFIK